MKAVTLDESVLSPEIVEKFVDYLRFEKNGGLSEGTINRYLLNLRHLSQESRRPLLEIKTYQDLSACIRALRQRHGWSRSTTKNAADTCSIFYTWALRHGYIRHEDHPMIMGHEFKRGERVQMEIFEWSAPEFKKMLYNPHNSLRDHALMHVLRSSGIRAGTACTAQIRDVNLGDRWLRVRDDKGGKDRDVPFDEEAQKWLALYIPEIQLHSLEPWLFQTDDFRQFTNQSLYKLIVRKAEQVGIHATPQSFRRSLGGEMLEAGADITVVQKTLGHARAATTADYYMNIKTGRHKKLYDQHIPKISPFLEPLENTP